MPPPEPYPARERARWEEVEMNSKKRSGSGIFLMEMIMVCGFFLLCAAVCIQVFLKSDSMSRLAREKNQAVLAAESLADAWKVYGREGLEPIFPHPSAVDGDGKSLPKPVGMRIGSE